MMPNMKFSLLLNQYRTRRGLSKSELATKLNVHKTYIGGLENGREKPPTLDRCLELAKILDLKPVEKTLLVRLAYDERQDEKDLAFREALKLQPNDRPPTHLFEVPVVSWVQANRFADIEDPFPSGLSDEYIYTSVKGKNIFAIKVREDCMFPEFQDGDIIIVNPHIEAADKDFVIVADRKAGKATFKQIRKHGRKTVLHPLNPKYNDIELDEDERYEIIGVIVAREKKYK